MLVAHVISLATKLGTVRWTAVCGASGTLALLLALIFYVLGRADGTVYLLPVQLTQILPTVGSVAALGSLPTFLHVFSFVLLTVAVARPQSATTCVAIACGWCIANVLFETGQHPGIAPLIDGVLPASFDSLPILENIGPFFLNGTFDPLDVLAAVLGAVTSISFIFWMRNRESES
jgi:hypothetical protein